MNDQSIDLSNHCFTLLSNDLLEIMSPLLLPFKITFFRYLRLYKDGARIDLCTNSTWTNHFYNNNFYKVAWWDRSFPTSNIIERTLWDEKCLTNDNIVGIHARTVFDIIHGFSIIKPNKDYCEIYDFATTSNNVVINDVYINCPEYFESAILYFNNQADSLILEAEKHKIFLPLQNAIDFTPAIDCSVISKMQKIYIDAKHNGAYLTRKEFDCLSFWVSGKTAKQIGLILDISHRTVETHFENIKGKLNINNKNQLVSKLQELGLFEMFIKNGLRLLSVA